MKTYLVSVFPEICHMTGGDLSHDRRNAQKLIQENARFIWTYATGPKS